MKDYLTDSPDFYPHYRSYEGIPEIPWSRRRTGPPPKTADEFTKFLENLGYEVGLSSLRYVVKHSNSSVGIVEWLPLEPADLPHSVYSIGHGILERSRDLGYSGRLQSLRFEPRGTLFAPSLTFRLQLVSKSRFLRRPKDYSSVYIFAYRLNLDLRNYNVKTGIAEVGIGHHTRLPLAHYLTYLQYYFSCFSYKIEITDLSNEETKNEKTFYDCNLRFIEE